MPEKDVQTLGKIAKALSQAGQGNRVTVADMVEAIGHHSFLPLILVPALLAATPLSGVPGVSAVCGLTIVAVSLQMLMGFSEVKLPGFLMRRSVKADALRSALDKARPVLGWIDRHTRKRLSPLFHRPVVYIPRVLFVVSGLAMPFLEVIPFSASTVAIGVACLALSMLTRDGALFLLALVPYAILVWLLVRLL